MLDVDALAREENANWVYQGMQCLPPEETRCLVSLSDGGRDANVVREFDTRTRRFVEGGFSLPNGKQNAVWEDENTILVARDWGEGTMTPSGYPFVVKRLRRGQTLDQAEEVYRGQADDVRRHRCAARRDGTRAGGRRRYRDVDFFNAEYRRSSGPAATSTLPIPRKASLSSIIDGRLLVTLDEAWDAGNGLSFAADSVVSYDLESGSAIRWARGRALVWAPGPRQTLIGHRRRPAANCSSRSSTMSAAAPSRWTMRTGAGGRARSRCRATRRSASPPPPTRTSRRCSASPTI